ncbi:NmrA family NAD(P)-binding protein [Haloprofundus halobius]|uniref:NmrA family NAD(P)-binding protein n=1 Tax=Haloprofundus halobius TaxID=2876194 RepID=UPI001CCD6C3A|nr:NmrA family NAD(P)-binding protein [Haloprofundus halobius]
MTRRVLVANATGRLGKAVAEHLSSDECETFDVRVLTDTSTPDVTEFRTEQGPILVEVDASDADALATAVEDADALFLSDDADDADAERERIVAMGEALVEAAERANLPQFVYASAGGVESETDVPELDAIHAVERRVRDADVPWTVLRPALLMQQFESCRGGIESGTLTLPLEEGSHLHLVDAADVAAVVARVLDSPDTFLGETLELAADAYTLDELASMFADVLGHEVTGIRAPMDAVREELTEERVTLFEFVNDGGYDVDVEAIRERYEFEFTSFEEYLDANWSAAAPEPSTKSTAD